jgi:hypothetical protein
VQQVRLVRLVFKEQLGHQVVILPIICHFLEKDQLVRFLKL